MTIVKAVESLWSGTVKCCIGKSFKGKDAARLCRKWVDLRCDALGYERTGHPSLMELRKQFRAIQEMIKEKSHGNNRRAVR